MGRQEDILFCKIAISTGLVSPENAQKCLAICDKREKEGGRRPAVGPVMAKHNLISQEDVRRITQAVNKRLGRTEQPVRGGRAKGKAKGKGGGGARRGRRGDVAPARKVDPSTLWMGIGMGVVFIGVILTIVFLYMSNAAKHEARKSGQGQSTAGSTPSSTSTTPSQALASQQTADPATQAAAATGSAAPAEALDEEFRRAHAGAIGSARQTAYALNMSDRAIAQLEAFRQEHDAEYRTPAAATLLEELERTLKEFRGEGDTTSPGKLFE